MSKGTDYDAIEREVERIVKLYSDFCSAAPATPKAYKATARPTALAGMTPYGSNQSIDSTVYVRTAYPDTYDLQEQIAPQFVAQAQIDLQNAIADGKVNLGPGVPVESYIRKVARVLQDIATNGKSGARARSGNLNE